MTAVVWHGTEAEALVLATVLGRHCDCTKTPEGQVLHVCPAHAMLADQRQLDGLLFERRQVNHLNREEWSNT